jgi:hypothetical protein
MSVDIRPPWLTPITYNDEPDVPDVRPVAPEAPIDYGRRADRDEVLGELDADDELEDDEEDDHS